MTVNEVAKSGLNKSILRVSTAGEKPEELCKGLTDGKVFFFQKKKSECLQILTYSFHYNGLESLEDLYLTPLDLLLGVHKGSTYGGYLSISMVGAMIYVKNVLSLSKS